MDLEKNRIFLVGTGNVETNDRIESMIHKQIAQAKVFHSLDGVDAQFKSENVPPHVAILDFQLAKVSATELTSKLIRRKDRVAVIIIAPPEDKDVFIDEVVTGQVQFISSLERSDVFANHLTRALNWVSNSGQSTYHLRFINPGHTLMKEGDRADFVYLVKSGELKAFRKSDDREVELGKIAAGEFVGEMAYINGEPRSANVVALSSCELIEIPSNRLDSVLFSKPAWSKALLRTLSKRLKSSNDEKA